MKRSHIWILIFLSIFTFAQIIWWAYLITSQQESIATLEGTPSAFLKSQDYKTMIIFEALFFLCIWSFGFFLFYKSFKMQHRLQEQKEDFLSAITHELNTPIANIQLCFETLERSNLPPEKIKTYTHRGLKETERLFTEIKSILKLNEDLINRKGHRETLENIFERIKQDFQNERSRLQFISKNNLSKIKAPSTEMEIILKNLLSNALKFSSEKVEIEAHRVSHNKARLEIRDSGIGFDPSEQIKTAFYKGRFSKKFEFKGTGLGLTLADRIARRTGISINITSSGFQKGTLAIIKWSPI